MPDIWFDVDAAISEAPVNIAPLIDDTDFKTRETAITYNQAGMDLVWNFVTSAGAFTQTAVTPTTAGVYDWTNQGDGMYTIEIPASGGGSINNDTEGYGWFTGFCTGVLPWRGPVIGFRAAGLNDLLCDSAYSTTRGLAGTAVPNAAAGAAGGLPTDSTGKTSFNDLSAAQVNAEADTALSDYDPPTNTEMVAAFTEIKGATWSSGTDTLEHIRDKETDIETDTNELQTDWTNGGRLDLIIDAILAMLDDPRAEPGQGAPAVNADMATKVDYLYKAWRNKSTQTSTTYSLYDDAGTTVDQKSTDSDDGSTATKGEVGTGP